MKQRNQSPKNLQILQKQLDIQSQRFRQAYSSGDYHTALDAASKAHRLIPNNIKPLSDMATTYTYLEQWDNAIKTAQKILRLEPNHLNSLDILAHAYGAKRDWQKAGLYGHQALTLRDQQISQKIHKLPDLATAFMDRDTAPKQNLISFSLFGNRSEYIETAVINAQIVAKIYPTWQCRFYVDDSVPNEAITRLSNTHSQVVKVTPEQSKLPGTMWRFLAMDDENVGYVLFRDVDSVISHREASTVKEWLESKKCFHTIRDSGSHTELILAGLWGAKAGSVPNIFQLMKDYLQKNTKITRHTDQYFLRESVWQYVRQDLYSSDRIFDFMNAHPITDIGFDYEKTHIGCDEGNAIFTLTSTDLNVGDKVSWQLISQIDPCLNIDLSHNLRGEQLICQYEALIEKTGILTGKIPRIYAQGIPTKQSRIIFKKV
ncbi:hypothetical protein BKG92_01135 [Rodentibacter ratti]|uniref:Uncharacterized protein n=1 Tax=Rodentibacter ratti TaxID=1906745 RepID=A0A1V3L2H7_9PAST|nr:hypothetical protein BKG92_01135 [Rodentibacter ratti]